MEAAKPSGQPFPEWGCEKAWPYIQSQPLLFQGMSIFSHSRYVLPWRACPFLNNLPRDMRGLLLGFPSAISSAGWTSSGPSVYTHRTRIAPILMDLCWTSSRLSLSFCTRKSSNFTQYSKCSLMSAKSRVAVMVVVVRWSRPTGICLFCCRYSWACCWPSFLPRSGHYILPSTLILRSCVFFYLSA